MKISFVILLSISVSKCFVPILKKKYYKITKFKTQKNLNDFVKDNVNSTMFDTTNYNSTLNNSKDSVDLVEKYSNWFGIFPKEKKWKSIRFTIYSICAGYCLAEGVDKFINLFSEQPLQDYFDK